MQARESGYSSELARAMLMLSRDRRVVFLGQGVACKGTFMSGTLRNGFKRIELPVAEEMQMGMSIGLALAGYVPVTLYPRWNFLLLAANQLVNHLDKLDPQPRVIVRVGIGSETPLDPGPQHVGDFTEAFRSLLEHTPVIRLEVAKDIVPAYQHALKRDGATILVEYGDRYNV